MAPCTHTPSTKQKWPSWADCQPLCTEMCPDTLWIVGLLGPEPVWIRWQWEQSLAELHRFGCRMKNYFEHGDRVYITWGTLNAVCFITNIKHLHKFMNGIYDMQFLLSPVYRLYCVKASEHISSSHNSLPMSQPCSPVFYFIIHEYSPIPLAMPSKTWFCHCSLAGIASTNRAGGLDIYLLW